MQTHPLKKLKTSNAESEIIFGDECLQKYIHQERKTSVDRKVTLLITVFFLCKQVMKYTD